MFNETYHGRENETKVGRKCNANQTQIIGVRQKWDERYTKTKDLWRASDTKEKQKKYDSISKLYQFLTTYP